MPRKKPWTTTPSGHRDVEGVEARPEDRDVGRPRSRSRRRRPARRRSGGGRRRSPCGCPGRRSPARWRARLAILPKRPEVWRSIRRSKSSGSSAISRPMTIASRRQRRRDHGPGERRLAREHPGPQQHAEDHQRDQVDRVEDDQERDHPADRLAPLHPGLAQRPVGEQDAAGAAGREEPGGRQPGHRDLVALAPLQVDHLLADDAAEERDVGREHHDAEDDPDRDPDRVALRSILPSASWRSKSFGTRT